jgi:hypothetical protein
MSRWTKSSAQRYPRACRRSGEEAYAPRVKLLALIRDRRRKRAQRKLESAAARRVYSHSREGRAAAEQGRRDTDTSGMSGGDQ